MFYDTAPARINAPWIWSVFNLLLKWEFSVLALLPRPAAFRRPPPAPWEKGSYFKAPPIPSPVPGKNSGGTERGRGFQSLKAISFHMHA